MTLFSLKEKWGKNCSSCTTCTGVTELKAAAAATELANPSASWCPCNGFSLPCSYLCLLDTPKCVTWINSQSHHCLKKDTAAETFPDAGKYFTHHEEWVFRGANSQGYALNCKWLANKLLIKREIDSILWDLRRNKILTRSLLSALLVQLTAVF